MSPNETIYRTYPRHVAPQAAFKAIAAALKSKPFEHLLARTEAYAQAVKLWPPTDMHFIPHPATWFNRGSYDDDPTTWIRHAATATDPSHGRGFELKNDYSGITGKDENGLVTRG